MTFMMSSCRLLNVKSRSVLSQAQDLWHCVPSIHTGREYSAECAQALRWMRSQMGSRVSEMLWCDGMVVDM